MKKGRPKSTLTEKEEIIMQMLWNHGSMFVREIVELYDEPRPHFNTVATTIRILEQKGHVAHEVVGGSHRFYAISQKEQFCQSSMSRIIRDYFSNSYLNAVSSLVREEKITVDELKELIEMVESQQKK